MRRVTTAVYYNFLCDTEENKDSEDCYVGLGSTAGGTEEKEFNDEVTKNQTGAVDLVTDNIFKRFSTASKIALV